MVTKVGKELLGQLNRDRLVLLPLTDKIFGKTEVTDKGVAPPHPTPPLLYGPHVLCFLFYKRDIQLEKKQFFCIIFVILIR